jgi:hypothetical protein
VTTPLEDRIRSAFETHAGGPADDDLDTVLSTAVRGGTRIRRRRAATAVAGVAVLAVATAGVLATAGRPTLIGTATPSASATAPAWGAVPETSSTTMPSPPDAPAGTTSAATDPTVVGTDVGLLHFGLSTLPVPSAQVSWGSEPGVEYANLAGAAPPGSQEWPTTVVVTRSEAALATPNSEVAKAGTIAAPTTVGDRPATLLTQPHATEWFGPNTLPRDAHAIRWQPAPGVWAQVESRSLAVDKLVRIAAGLKLDTTYRCKVPVRTAAPPAGSKVTLCAMTYTATRPLETFLYYGDQHGSQLTVVLVGPRGQGCGGDVAPRPKKAAVPQLCYLGTHVVRGWSVYIDHQGKYTDADETRAAAALRLAADPNDIDTWFPASAG